LDALVVFSPENVLYTCDCQIDTQKGIRDRLAASVFIPDKDPSLILCSIEQAQAEEESWIKDLVPYTEFVESPISAVIRGLKSKGVGKGRIGLDLSYLAASFYNEFMAEAPQATLVDCTDLMVQMRAIKTQKEVMHQERITRITVKVIEDAFAATKVGDTDTDVYKRIIHGLVDNGGKPDVAVVAAAERGSVAHPTPVDYKLKSGDVMRVDIVCYWGGYMSDVARTVCIGEPSQRTRQNYTKLARIQKSIIDKVKPDIPVSSLYDFCAESFKNEGLPFGMPHIGHGMGLEIHEYPMIHPANHDPIKEGMVINIEPLLIDQEQRFGYHIEDLVEVTADGKRVLTGTTFPIEIPLTG
jgi:Xaa-Pro aminopeptidase